MKNKLFKPFIVIFLIVAVFLFSRVTNLNSLPVFGDEAIYVRWSQLIKNVETLRFVPLTDGKQPLFMWLTVPFFKIYSDPLTAGRMVSVFSGLGLTIVLIFTVSLFTHLRLSKSLETLLSDTFQNPPKSAFFAGLIYICLPFTFFFDRLSLADTLLSLFGLISLFLTILLSKYPRLDLALLLGFSLGLAWLTKSPAIYFTVLSIATFIFLNIKKLKTIIYPIISVVLSQIIYNLLRLGPQFHQIALRNQDYVWRVSDILKNPFDPLIPHLIDTVNIYLAYLSLPLIIGLIVLLFINRRQLTKFHLILALWWFLPLLANSMFAKVYTARYILFTLPPLIVITGLLLHKLRYSWLLFIFLIPNLVTIYRLSTNPFTFTSPPTEAGYFQDWTSGWGIKPTADFLKQRSLEANVIVGTEGYFGTLPDGLQIYTDSVSRLTVFGIGVDNKQIPEKLIDAFNHGDEVYLLLNSSRNQLTPDQLNRLQLTLTFPKPSGDSLDLYQLLN